MSEVFYVASPSFGPTIEESAGAPEVTLHGMAAADREDEQPTARDQATIVDATFADHEAEPVATADQPEENSADVAPAAAKTTRDVPPITEAQGQILMETYLTHSQLLLTIAWRIVKDRDAAEDIVQATFVRAWEKFGTYQGGEESMKAWLATIARNQSFDWLRKHNREIPHGFQDMEGDTASWRPAIPSAEAVFLKYRDGSGWTTAMRALPPRCRRTFELYHRDGLSHSQIAEITGAPVGTIKSQLRRGTCWLRPLVESGVIILG